MKDTKNRKKTSFTLSEDCVLGLKHLASINNRSCSNQIEELVANMMGKRKNDFFKHMNKRHKNS